MREIIDLSFNSYGKGGRVINVVMVYAETGGDCLFGGTLYFKSNRYVDVLNALAV